jgi:hypothetical protein
LIRIPSRCFANGSRKPTLLQLIGGPVADSLSGAKWLTPFGVEIRYPGDTAEMLPGEEGKAIEIATQVKQVVLAVLVRG